MINQYKGKYPYNRSSILQNAPDSIGVYYCCNLGTNGQSHALYIGRAKGDGVSIRSRLLDHIRDENWPDVTHFGYYVCSTKQEAEDLEIQEIRRCNPKYNIQWTPHY